MKILLYLALFVVTVLLFWQCNRTTYTAETFPTEEYLAFGQGGGYAGSLTTHYLLANGQLFKSEGIEGPKIDNGKIGKGRAKKILRVYQEELQQFDYQNPGNLYYFLEFVSADTTHEIQWGGSQDKAPQAALDFYQELQSILPQE